MDRPTLYVHLSPYDGALGYLQTRACLEDGDDLADVHTYCLNFFQPEYFLDWDYNVVAVNGDKTIHMWKLLKGGYGYTAKEIRPAHNTSKMLIAGCFTFQSDS